jgi:hypothetical protein
VPVVLTPKFKKRLQDKQPKLAAAILQCIHRIEENPRQPGLHVHRMHGAAEVWEAYVDRSNRVTFHYDESGAIVFRNHCNHDILRQP